MQLHFIRNIRHHILISNNFISTNARFILQNQCLGISEERKGQGGVQEALQELRIKFGGFGASSMG